MPGALAAMHLPAHADVARGTAAAANTSTATSACASVMISGGENRIVFLPHSSSSSPRLKQSWATAPASSGVASSTPIMRPTPRMSVTIGLARQLLLQRRLERAADAGGVGEQLLLQQVDGREPGGDRDGVARDGRAVAARRPGHDLLLRDHRAQRHARRDPLGDEHDVGDDAGVLGGEHLAGPPHAALHLVEHQQDAVAVGDRAQPRRNSGGGTM